MARREIPLALEMRDIKYVRRSDAEKDRVAARLREAGRRSEAILLFEHRADHPFLAEEKTWAVSDGRTFHLLGLRRLGVPVAPEELRATARAAEAAGRWLEARLAYVQLSDEEAVRRIAEHLPESVRPAPEVEEEPAE